MQKLQINRKNGFSESRAIAHEQIRNNHLIQGAFSQSITAIGNFLIILMLGHFSTIDTFAKFLLFYAFSQIAISIQTSFLGDYVNIFPNELFRKYIFIWLLFFVILAISINCYLSRKIINQSGNLILAISLFSLFAGCQEQARRSLMSQMKFIKQAFIDFIYFVVTVLVFISEDRKSLQEIIWAMAIGNATSCAYFILSSSKDIKNATPFLKEKQGMSIVRFGAPRSIIVGMNSFQNAWIKNQLFVTYGTMSLAIFEITRTLYSPILVAASGASNALLPKISLDLRKSDIDKYRNQISKYAIILAGGTLIVTLCLVFVLIPLYKIIFDQKFEISIKLLLIWGIYAVINSACIPTLNLISIKSKPQILFFSRLISFGVSTITCFYILLSKLDIAFVPITYILYSIFTIVFVNIFEKNISCKKLSS